MNIKGVEIMKAASIRAVVIIVLAVLLGACSTGTFYHDNFMSGQVVKVEGKQAVICIGSADNTKPGTVFEVFEVIYEGTIMEGTDNYRLEKVGALEIQSIVDGHFARARIVGGTIERYNVVERKE
jgi:hypothetical protein